jgi:CubicO group peptidase (beta-lactamase class C family)
MRDSVSYGMPTSVLVRLAAAATGVAAMAFAAQQAMVPAPATPGTITKTPPAIEAKVDQIFQKWTTSPNEQRATPGCTVGVAVDGKQTLAKAYGLADLERDIPNTPDTIFEAGSVSKQFTAAAVLLLAKDGKLSLDDPVRKHIPELPEYGAPLTIRHLLTHTSGLRDWGAIEDIAGWPRGTRSYTQAHVLDILHHQHALNFPSGTRWSYTNSGYNLAAMIVTRVSGMSFADFTRVRIFTPLGMSHSSWRDDHTRIVKHRAIAYDEMRDGFHTQMPFENVYGNSSLLTTVGDLLIWNENFVSPKVGDAAFVREQETPGTFSDGRAHNYGMGLVSGTYKGLREISHTGATAGYRAALIRFPDQHVSVAVLCNAGSALAPQYMNEVADLFLADQLKEEEPPKATHTLTRAESDRIAGLYRHTVTGMPMRIVRDDKTDALRMERGPALIATSARTFVTAYRDKVEINDRGLLRRTDAFGSVDEFQSVPAVTPESFTPKQLEPLRGSYTSEDAEATLTVALLGPEGKALVIMRRPDKVFPLTPLYADAFLAPDLGVIIFHRDRTGRVTELSVSQDRVWDLRFTRSEAPASDRSSTHGAPE